MLATVRRMRLTMLSPTIQMVIAQGTEPPALSLQQIIESQLPPYWKAQESLVFGQGN
ncbi:MAG: hypothetical protein AAGH57_07525 [Pseudomonadota bacterium]